MAFMRDPTDWNELEILCCQLFRELDCHCEVQKNINTVRGEVNIDVYVEDPISTIPMVYLCECKYWKKSVSKNVVHSFRTVLNDFGANRGFIISASGFQGGAFEAATNSNVELVSWNEIQSLFKERWVDTMRAKLNFYAQKMPSLVENTFQKIGRWDKWDNNEQADFMDIFFKFSCLASIGIGLGFDQQFPKEVTNPYNKREMMQINSIREYFDIAISLGKEVTEKLDQFPSK